MIANRYRIPLMVTTALLTTVLVAAGQPAAEVYRMPPQAIADIADAAPSPSVRLDPTSEWMLILEEPTHPSIAELAAPELRLAGIRIAPATNSRSRRRVFAQLTLERIADRSTKPVTGLPENARIDDIHFSPDGTTFAFSLTTDSTMELWLADVDSGRARRLASGLNGVYYGAPFAWMSDSRHVLAKVVPESRGGAPAEPSVPSGPVVQQSTGQKAAARTYQDLLENPHDEALFAHYLTAEIVRLDTDRGSSTTLVASALIGRVDSSPDGRYVLVEKIKRPFSYLVPVRRFGRTIEIRDADGRLVREVANLPLAENVPIGRNAVRTGPRDLEWRADEDAALFWVEAQDGGDPKAEAGVREKLFTLRAPFDGEPLELASLELRFRGIYWGNGELALVREWWWGNRRERLSRLRPAELGARPEPLFDYSYEDRYNAPGFPLMRSTDRGTRVIETSRAGDKIYLVAEGASPEGNRPFVDELDLKTKETTRLWRSEAPYYEYPTAWLDLDGRKLLTRRESRMEPPNYFVRDLGSGEARKLTTFPHPYPQLQNVDRELIRYDRRDGMKLTATLYLPAGYKKSDDALPTLVWAYPREYKSADAAAQVRDSPHRFSRISWGSPLYWLTQGYAVVEGATMPIVGEGDEEPNDTYVKQLVASAQAVVDEVVRRGVTDRDRVAIGGHSYGAFMSANLLAHSDIFRAGIARSGAYNRTLTPFGFQSEERTFWEAPEIYFAMSPFMHAQKIDEPILLIHGIADNNSGTFPIQSERLYHALKGHGATARLVMLPHESHGYRSRESVMHTLWEMHTWLETYVKDAAARKSTTDDNPGH